MKDIMHCIKKFLKEKAAKIGATLIIRHCYANVCTIKKTTRTKIYISVSKNSRQYLDSFDGSTSESHCYKDANAFVMN